MPTWVDIFQEMQAAGPAVGAPLDLDGVRRAKMQAVEALTGRPLVVYAVDMQNPAKSATNPILGLINHQDKDGFTDAIQRIQGDRLDVLLQSPGGLAEATESIVALLRARFSEIRFIVPSMAKSAATMLAMSGDELLLGINSELGPIDPQMANGRGGYSPAQAILDQFEQAKTELQATPAAMPAWMPILQQFGPSLLQECQHHLKLSEQLVSTWLETYMLKGQADAKQQAALVSAKLNDHAFWRSHNRRVDMHWLTGLNAGLKITNLDSNPQLAAAVWSLHLALSITFMNSGTVKIVESSSGDAFILFSQIVNLQFLPTEVPAPAPTPPAPVPGPPRRPPAVPPKKGQRR